jgi:hypothetical protein
MRFEVEVIVPHPLDDQTAEFLTAAQASANKVVRFCGDGNSIRLTVEAIGMNRNEAVRQAAREIAKVFPSEKPEFVCMTENNRP